MPQSPRPPAVPSAGKKRFEHTTFAGLPITLEYRKGDVRSGKDAQGQRWFRKMEADYGYIRKTKGVDGDQLDVYIGPEASNTVFVVDQMKPPDFKEFDEQKFMLGFGGLEKAKKSYLAHYPTQRFLGKIKPMPLAKFIEKAMHSKRKGIKLSAESDQSIRNRHRAGGAYFGAAYGGAAAVPFVAASDAIMRRARIPPTRAIRAAQAAAVPVAAAFGAGAGAYRGDRAALQIIEKRNRKASAKVAGSKYVGEETGPQSRHREGVRRGGGALGQALGTIGALPLGVVVGEAAYRRGAPRPAALLAGAAMPVLAGFAGKALGSQLVDRELDETLFRQRKQPIPQALMRERELAHLGVAALHGASVVGSIGASGGARTGLIGAGVGALTAMGLARRTQHKRRMKEKARVERLRRKQAAMDARYLAFAEELELNEKVAVTDTQFTAHRDYGVDPVSELDRLRRKRAKLAMTMPAPAGVPATQVAGSPVNSMKASMNQQRGTQRAMMGVGAPTAVSGPQPPSATAKQAGLSEAQWAAFEKLAAQYAPDWEYMTEQEKVAFFQAMGRMVGAGRQAAQATARRVQEVARSARRRAQVAYRGGRMKAVPNSPVNQALPAMKGRAPKPAPVRPSAKAPVTSPAAPPPPPVAAGAYRTPAPTTPAKVPAQAPAPAPVTANTPVVDAKGTPVQGAPARGTPLITTPQALMVGGGLLAGGGLLGAGMVGKGAIDGATNLATQGNYTPMGAQQFRGQGRAF
jgi:hypothetical protein